MTKVTEVTIVTVVTVVTVVTKQICVNIWFEILKNQIKKREQIWKAQMLRESKD